MPRTATSLVRKFAVGLSVAVGGYAIILGLLLTPSVQRFAIYAHRINTLFLGDDLNVSEAFGFAKHQVTPFNLQTPDGETLYAWHVLPLDIYTRHEKALREESRPYGPVDDFTKTSAFARLTGNDPSPARVVVTCTEKPNTHVLTIDYRGFGYSTGSPTEAGLITDGTTLVEWVMKVAGIPPDRIVIIGQSLGTAVSSAVALHFADPGSELIPSETRELWPSSGQRIPTAFLGIVLVAPFSSLPSLMLTYRIGGVLPILLPLRPFPYIAGILTSRMPDKWLSADRLSAYYGAFSGSLQVLSSTEGRSIGSLQIIHSVRDMDIPYHQTEMICRRIFREGSEPGVYEGTEAEGRLRCIDGSRGPGAQDVKEKGRPKVRFEIVEYGGEYLENFLSRLFALLTGHQGTIESLRILLLLRQ
ncbi:hypothetical protein LTS16_023050 [Friedmanniomyces endolithicus]|uniref:AB hydrolase-1 domain-containing protein n=1 Tax=Friedmanniomyces endolithicus TaxID=329885 RepID=A0AAN6J4N6_9PEZI|nr:hypothetical protein LTS09_015825 [Friedmanniomyces endolithicus]KAK0277588.1 hypothetical protein LTS00_014079 [Friedmanniomyces endolithicus]KAK0314288.1 hypothetical protein LTR82_013005 [Friedmanniomyces endolithicus]KAK0976038.1 hypothetical protein LTR54_016645 [Friedmanniomyces endolithicus]KAK1011466.1 hypothetical protein LTS01_001322 [Friedmanniomyces endolithicus]